MDTSNFENFSKSLGYLLLVTLCGADFQNQIDLEFLGNVINYICHEICCGIFALQIACVLVDGSFMFESLLLCISMVPF